MTGGGRVAELSHPVRRTELPVNPRNPGPSAAIPAPPIRHAGRVRIVLVAEAFLPQMNGVVNSLLQMLRHLEAQGHETLVIAPRTAESPDPRVLHGADLALLRSIPAPTYPEVRVVLASVRKFEALLRDFRPDVIHLASPFVLGWQALRAADRLGIPTVAIYQTDIPGYAERYGLPALAPALTRHVARIHRRATLTLAPSSASISELEALGVERLRLWARGVDGERFTPDRRSADWRHSVAPEGEAIIGYVGRLAPEKQVEDLAALAGIPGTKLVIVGDGPSRPALERLLPDAVFLGFLGGDRLAEAVASFDLFVHPGESETFCQTVQEALASGVPVVATGRGGPLDLVQNSRTGWLYRPGDLDDLRARVLDLVGDDAKRRAFAVSARASVAHRTWSRLGDELLGHYRDAIAHGAVTPVTAAVSSLAASRVVVREHTADTALEGSSPAPGPRWTRYVALGDSLTEGLCDSSRQADGVYRGWADRLATFLAHTSEAVDPAHYANLAVRSRRIDDVVRDQIPQALELGADLVSVLVGANDLVQHGARPERLADRLAEGVVRLRESGADVLIVTPFAPHRSFLRPLHARLGRFNAALARTAADTGSMLLDFWRDPICHEGRAWAADRVHLSSHGHRMLSYRAAAAIGIPGAREIGALDALMHEDEPVDTDTRIPTPQWMWTHARPWAIRRMRGRAAGDGLPPKQPLLMPVLRLHSGGRHPAITTPPLAAPGVSSSRMQSDAPHLGAPVDR
jgi:phosphatidylinositol alpha 1,6-mannosyltransferase